jgi:hypothetical protein
MVQFQQVFLWIVISCSSGCSPAYVLCNVYGENVKPGLCIASGSGCKLVCILRFLSIYLIVEWCTGDSKHSMLWMVLNAIPTVVCLNRFVTEWTSRPRDVNLTHFLGLSGPWSQWWLFVFLLAVEVLYWLACRVCLITVSSGFLGIVW